MNPENIKLLVKNMIKTVKSLLKVMFVKAGLTVYYKMNITFLNHQKQLVENIFHLNILKIF